MSSARRAWLCSLAILAGACGADPDPSTPGSPNDASTSIDGSRDSSTSRDTATDRGESDGTFPFDGAVDGAATDDSTIRDASSDEAFAPDAPDTPHADRDAIDVTSSDSDAAPPGPDGSNDSGTTLDGGVDGDAPTTPDAEDSSSDRVDETDASHDVADSNSDAGGLLDIVPDVSDSAADGDGGAASGFPGSTLVDIAQGAMINGWVGTPTQLWTRCYTTALHPKSGQAFHTNCDFKGASVSIARVSYMGNVRVMGGYNSTSWFSPTSASYGSNTGSFLFSVTNSFKHDYPGSSSVPYYIYNNQYYGPTFGAGNDWYVHSQMTFGTCRPGYTYQCRVGTVDSAQCNTDFCGTTTSSDYYTLEELEVWVK